MRRRRGFNERMRSYFRQLMPEGVGKVPDYLLYSVGALFMLATFAFFVYFFITNIVEQQSQKFLSLDDSAGICETVPRTLNGKYFVDTNGYWEKQENFLYPNSIYVMEFSNLAVSYEEWNKMFTDVGAYVSYVGNLSTSLDLTRIILLWTTWRMYTSMNGRVSAVAYACANFTLSLYMCRFNYFT